MLSTSRIESFLRWLHAGRPSGVTCRWLCAWFAMGTVAVSLAYEMESLQRLLNSRFGPARIALLQDWHKTLGDARALPEREKLVRVNAFFNKRIEFTDDLAAWNQSDYWATPIDLMGQGRGDCEDFAIAKYLSLKEIGVVSTRLRLVYVKARLSGSGGTALQAHMVLAYYPAANAEPLILDNLVPDIKPASQRPDLQPVFSFNSEAVFQGVAENSAKGAGGTKQLSRWEDLLQRARAEGFH